VYVYRGRPGPADADGLGAAPSAALADHRNPGEQGDERGDAALVALEVPVNAWTRRSRLVVAG
jgi:hypothetical protein